MIDEIGFIEKAFDSCAGAGISFAGITSACMDSAPCEEALFLWLLVSHAIAVGGDQGGAVDWLDDQVGLLSMHSSQLGMTLRARLQGSWAAWMPAILWSATKDSSMTWSSYCKSFPAQSDEEESVRELLSSLLAEHGHLLYNSSNLPEHQRGASPDCCVLLKLGQAVRRLRDSETVPERKVMFANWREVLLELLKRLPDRITRGSSPEWPIFEDMVLCLSYVAEWLVEPDSRRIPDFVNDYARHPREKLSPNQLALCAALFGWLQGYRRIGSLLQDNALRRVIAQAGMAVAVKGATINTQGLPLEDPIAFYSTDDGTSTALRRFVELAEMKQRETVEKRWFLSSTGRMWKAEMNVTATAASAEYHVAQSLRFRLET